MFKTSVENVKLQQSMHTCSRGLAVSTTDMYSDSPLSDLCNFNTGGSTPHKYTVPKNNIRSILRHISASS